MDPALLAIIDRCGIWLRREANDLGYHDQRIEQLIRDETWHRVRWGAYTYTELWKALDRRQCYGLLCHAAYRSARTKVALSHRSSANEWGAPLWDVDLTEVDLTRQDRRSGRRAAGIAQHRGVLVDGDWVERNGLAVTSATRTALELTTQLDVEHSMVEIDFLLHAGLTTSEQLASRVALMDRWPRTLHTDLILRLVDGRAESVAESRLRYLCWTQHLPAPTPNYPIRDRTGRVLYRVDLAWPKLGLFVEFDGREKYLRMRRDGESIADCIERERRRENHICELTGWRCLRLVWADLYLPRETADRIRAMFRSAAA